MKKIFSLGLALAMAAAAVVPSASAAGYIDYVALGDSIARGQTPYKEFGKSYTDLIAQELDEYGTLASFTKEFTLSGETSALLKQKIQESDVQETVKEAELITISTGANDVLALLKQGDLTIEKAYAALSVYQQNLTFILQTIEEINPKADVYVFGYYFPFTNLTDEEQKQNYELSFSVFNDSIKTTAEKNGAVFVEVSSQFSPDYLPNPADVHPNEAGYAVFAEQFFKLWTNYDPFSDIGTISSQGRTAIMALWGMGVLNGRADGNFAPKSDITRAEAAIILARALDVAPATKNPGFSDLAPSMKSYEAIAALTEAGVFSKAKQFKPDQLLTRAQMARILSQAWALESAGTVAFSDVPASHWAFDEIAAVASNGVMNGGANDRFLPDHRITREQFAMTIFNAIQE